MKRPGGPGSGHGRAWALAAALGCGACATARPAAAPPRAETTAARRPNIILILTDDMDLAPLQYMPHVRTHLAARGVSFSNMFVTMSVCAPSRASILRGQYVHNHQIFDNKPPVGSFRKFYELGSERSTIATWLQAAGYRTGLMGKYFNFYPMRQRNLTYVPPGWSEWNGVFFAESYYDYEINEDGRVVKHGSAPEDYLTDVLRAKALDFIARASESQPFFLYLSPFAPHAPPIPADRHRELFPDLRAPRHPNFNEEDVSDKPAWVRALPPMDEEVIEKSDEWFRLRVRTLQAVDEMIEKLVAALEERRLLDNTYLFFTSDNGFQLGAHRMDHGKGDAYDESIRVPLIVRGPGVPAGGQVGQMALNIDLAPTFAALAGATPGDFVDGRSLAPLLGRDPLPPASGWRTDFLVEHWTKDEGGIPEYSGLRTLEHLYVEYPDGERELYNLKKDPFQLHSNHQSADPALIRRLSERLAYLKKCRAEECRS